MAKLINLIIKIIVLVTLSVPTVSCNMKPKGNNSSSNKQGRMQKIINRDSEGRIVKTFDGFVYRIFDTLGRQIEWFGNYKSIENNSNFRTFVEYSDSVIIAKEYVLEDNNKECKIKNLLDCRLTKYYYKKGKLFKVEHYMRVISEGGKAIGHKLAETDSNPNMNPYIHKLPAYLK